MQDKTTIVFLVGFFCVWNYLNFHATIDHLKLPIITYVVAQRVFYGEDFMRQLKLEHIQQYRKHLLTTVMKMNPMSRNYGEFDTAQIDLECIRRQHVLFVTQITTELQLQHIQQNDVQNPKDEMNCWWRLACLGAIIIAMNVIFQGLFRAAHWAVTQNWAASLLDKRIIRTDPSEDDHSNSNYADTYTCSLKTKEVGVQTIEEMLHSMECPNCVDRTKVEDAVRKTSNADLNTASAAEDSGSSDSELEEIHTRIYREAKLKKCVHEVYRGQCNFVYLSMANNMSEDGKECIMKQIQDMFPERRFRCTDQASYSDMEYLMSDDSPHIQGTAAFGPGSWLLNIDTKTVNGTFEQHRLTSCNFADAHCYYSDVSIQSEIDHPEATVDTGSTNHPDSTESAGQSGLNDRVRAAVKLKSQKPYFGSLGCFASVGDDLFALTARHIIPNDDLLTVAGFSTEHKVMLVPEPRANQQYSIDFVDSLIIADKFKGLEVIAQDRKVVDIALIGPLHETLTKNPNHISMRERESGSELQVYQSDLGRAFRGKRFIKVFKVGAVTGFTKGVIVGVPEDGTFTVTSYKEEEHKEPYPAVKGEFAKKGDSGALVLLDNGELPFTGLGIIHKIVTSFQREERTLKNVIVVVSLKHSLDTLCVQNNIQNPKLYYHYFRPNLEISYHKSRMSQTQNDDD